METNEKKTKAATHHPVDPTGFDRVGFRPIGGQIAVILEAAQIESFKEAEKPAASNITIPKHKKLFLGEKLEKEKIEREEASRTYIVAAISKAVAANDDMPQVGDRVAFLNGTPINEFIVDGVTYGIVPSHKIAGVFSHKALITVSND